MASELPLACSLTGTELKAREAEIRAVGEAALLAAETDDARAVLRFRPDSRERLARIVAAEAECCPFLSLDLADEPAAVRLTVEASPGGEPVLQDLVGAFSGAR